MAYSAANRFVWDKKSLILKLNKDLLFLIFYGLLATSIKSPSKIDLKCKISMWDLIIKIDYTNRIACSFYLVIFVRKPLKIPQLASNIVSFFLIVKL